MDEKFKEGDILFPIDSIAAAFVGAGEVFAIYLGDKLIWALSDDEEYSLITDIVDGVFKDILTESNELLFIDAIGGRLGILTENEFGVLCKEDNSGVIYYDEVDTLR